MLNNHAQALLKRAAGAALERIVADRARSPWKVRPLLDHLATNLFDPDLNVDQLKRACSVRDNSIAVAFHASTGQPPGAYIADRRLETAGKLLRETELPVWQISDLVGYSSIQVFSRSFSRWAGKSPNAYRRSALAGRTMKGVSKPSLPTVLLRQRLEERRAEELEAEEFWLAIRERSWEIQRTAVRRGLGFRSAALFECLLKKTRQEGRDNRERGVEIARLAIESLVALEGVLEPEQLFGLAARGWAWLGNAHRLALDFHAAERAFTAAEHQLKQIPNDLRASAELLQNRGAFLWFQHRYDDALALEESALCLFRKLGKADLLAQALLVKSAICESAGALEVAIPVLFEARALVEHEREPYLSLSIDQILVSAYMQAGHLEHAYELLPSVKAKAIRAGSSSVAAHMTWVEGQLAQAHGKLESAEASFLEARSAFEQIEDSYHSALVAFDLTTVYWHTHRHSEILSLAAEMLRVFSAVAIPENTLMALRVFCQGLSSHEAAQKLLHEIRTGLEEVQRDPRRQTLRS